MKKICRKNDLILVLSLLIAATLIYLLIRAYSDPGAVVSVRVDGKEVASYSLNKDIMVTFKDGKVFDSVNGLTVSDNHIDNSGHGDNVTSSNADKNTSGYNILQIVDGEASVIDADCPDKICVHHNPISNEGESIICLPHKFSVHIEEEEK